MIVLLTGAPGAGKGTQAELLAERDGFRKISTGDALRRQIRLATPVGLKAKSFMDEGRLVPDEVLFDVLKAELGNNLNERILLDGYPRNISQAKTLKSMADIHPVKGAIHLDVDREALIARISGRRVCGQCGATFHAETNPPKMAGICDKCGGAVAQRKDDEESKVRVRLEVYDSETKPILDFYKNEGLYHRIDGNGDTENVYSTVKREMLQIL